MSIDRAVIHVVIVDDDALVREGLRLLLDLEQDICIVGEAVDGLDARAVIERSRPDLVLMDVRMPRCDGLTAARRELALRPDLAILMLTTFHADATVVNALRAGAKGYLLKDAEPAELMSALRTAATGRSVLAPVVLDRLIELATAGSQESAEQRRAFDELSARERQVAASIARGQSNAEIAQALFITVATVKTHASRVMDKLGVESRTQVAAVLHALREVPPVS